MTTETQIQTAAGRVDRLVEETSGGYSVPAYSESGWRGAIKMLIRRGLDDQQVVAVMLSKWTRWAADASGRYGRATGRDLERFMEGNWADVEALTREHFPDRAPAPVAERTYATARFDVTGLSPGEVDALMLEVGVQAEASDDHPDVPAPTWKVTRVPEEGS
jgi:hypothetical protein